MGQKQILLPEIDLDVVDVQAVAITATPRGETMISLEMSGGQIMNLIFSPATLAQLEAMLDIANEARTRERLRSPSPMVGVSGRTTRSVQVPPCLETITR